MHITSDLLAAAARCEISTREVTDLVLDHLLAVCPDCRRQVAALTRRGVRLPDYSRVWRALRERFQQEAPTIQRRKVEAEEWVRELASIEPSERCGTILRARTRFRGIPFVHRLLDESRSHLPAHPEEAMSLAQAAEMALVASGSCVQEADLWARALAYMANAYRASGNLRTADERFAQVRRLEAEIGISDVLTSAELDCLEGSLRKDQRRLEEAEQLLVRSATLYRLVKEPVEMARAYLNLGVTYNWQGSPQRAAQITQEALVLLDPQAQPRLFLCARHNLAIYLNDAGDWRRAREILEEDPELLQSFSDEPTRLRRTWLKGRILASASEHEAAEAAFEEVRARFSRRRDPFAVALVSLDLALLYHDQGRLGELAALTGQIVRLFRAQEVHREALTALLLLRDAIQQRQVTAEMLRRLSRYLEQARRDPSYRFTEPC